MSLRIRRGLSTDLPTPVEGELLYTTDNGNLYVGFLDPSTNTVVPRLTSGQLIDDDNPTLSSDLDLAGNNITGVGNITIDGTVIATGNINLGDQDSDTISINGQINTSLIPTLDGKYDLGNIGASWRQGFFEGVVVNGEIQTNTLTTEKLLAQDSTVVYDASLDLLTVQNIEAATIQADLIGSVFSNDSTTIIDGITNTISTGSITLENNVISTPNQGLTFDSDSNLYTFFTTGASPDPEFGLGDAIVAQADTFTGFEIRSRPVSDDFNGGEVLSSLFFTGEDSERRYGATAIGSQIDNNSFIKNTDYSATKFFVIVYPDEAIPEDFIAETSNDVARHLTFDSFGRLGVNTEDAQATLHVNGFALLEPQQEEPYNADDSTIPDGIVSLADGINWDPLANGKQSMVVRLDGSWVELASAP